MTDRETLRRLIAGDGETRIDSYEAADRVLAWLIQRLPSRAWEMGRDAAAERIDPASDLADHELTEWGMTRREAANQARALTPPATLAGIEISDEMVERASIAAWDAWNDVNDHRALGWPAWQSLHPVQAMEWRESIRAALTAALTDGESNG